MDIVQFTVLVIKITIIVCDITWRLTRFYSIKWFHDSIMNCKIAWLTLLETVEFMQLGSFVFFEICVFFQFLLPIIAIFFCSFFFDLNRFFKLFFFKLSIINFFISFYIYLYFNFFNCNLHLDFFENSNLIGFFFTFYFQFLFFDNYIFNHILFVDPLSSVFVLLGSILIPICILVNWVSIFLNTKWVLFFIFFNQFCLVNVFYAFDFFFFFYFFEVILIPVFFIIGFWGSPFNRLYASYKFFLFTLGGSLCLLVAILYLQFVTSTFFFQCNDFLFTLNTFYFKLLFILFFIGLGVKIPIFPFHTWLPEAHSEAPTFGSILLAGILLKVGGYAFFRWFLPFFIFSSGNWKGVNTFFDFKSFIFLFCILGVVYSGFVTTQQIDLKRVIAYSSVVHMNFGMLGLFLGSFNSIYGALLSMLAHGLTASALFFLIGILYERFGTRNIFHYSGVLFLMPRFSIFFLFFLVSNFSFPGTANFPGEMLIFIDIGLNNFFLFFYLILNSLFVAIFCIWTYLRVCYGPIFFYFYETSDLNRKEYFIVFYLSLLNIFVGLFPTFFISDTFFTYFYF